MVANSDLGQQLNRVPALVCYGVVNNVNLPRQDWRLGRLQILFSGTLLEEVGSKLLINAVRMLRQKQPHLVEKLHFVVTGKGPFAAAFRELAAQVPDWLSFGESLSRRSYLEVISSCHIGLSLRLAAHEMSTTTFPSKVVEYAQHGLLVLTTRASDVPLLFGDGALYLEDETAPALVAILTSLPDRKKELYEIASRGRARVLMRCSPETVGAGISDLLMLNGR
jgi:glycosyltransferase involved in cell wall biosynthesis